MVEEISLSISETNKLRAQIGLAPIPIEEETPKKDQPIAATNEISLEETNRLRVSIGLAPIPLSDSNKSVSREDDEIHNFKEHQQRIEKSKREDELKQRIEDAKSKSRKRKALIGKTLLDDEEEDTDDWLNSLGNNDSKKSKITKSSLSKSETDNVADVRIAHSLKEIQNLNNNDILTLDDGDILEDDDEVGGVLTNERLNKSSKLKKELDDKAEAESIKFNGRHYKASNLFGEENEEDEDEDIRSGVILKAGSSLSLNQKKDIQPVKTSNKVQLGQLFDDIDDDNDNTSINTVNDYAKEKPISMKKMKKKFKSKSKVVKQVLDEEGIPTVEFKKFNNDDFEDEEIELQRTLEDARRNKQKKQRSLLTPEEIAAEIVRVKRQELQDGIHDDFKQGVVFDDTSDFLASLSNNILDSNNGKVKEEADDSIFDEVKVKMEESSIEPVIKQEDNTDINIKQEVKKEEDEEDQIEDEETTPQFGGGGLASTLKFLQSRNILHQSSEQEKEEEKHRQEAIKESDILKIKISIEERILKQELESDKSYMNLPKSERNELFEKLLDEKLNQKGIVKEMAQPSKIAHRSTNHRNNNHNNSTGGGTTSTTINDHLKSYNPQVKLSYHDDTGNELNTKEAYKYLSHQFHGVGPSKNKQEKRKQRIKQEAPTSSLNGKIV
ncbi:SART-1 protein [Scheffersomyces coipomensis]|uniref:SART-1 protein n=1 Tax=Scheffersomyces coipomensis TaxID=1788519 RepID=UPI00315DAD55